MSSELYWDNLGIDSPEKKKQAVVSSAYEIVNFLKWAEKRLSYRVYSFNFKIHEIFLLPSNEDGLKALQDSKQVYVDGQLKHQVDIRSVVDPERFLIRFRSVPKEVCVFARSGDYTKKVDLRIQRAVLTDLEPNGVSEEDEDFALDLLFDQSDSVNDPGSIGHNGGIRILERHRNERKITLANLPFGNEFVVSYNTHVIYREYKAIESLVLRPKKHNLPLLNLLQKSWFAEWAKVQTDPGLPFYILKGDRDGTQQQREFVRKAVATPDFAILEGPPGSGKTTTILELILQLIPKGKRVLLVASTHVAVDNVIEKLMETKVDGQNLLEKFGVVPIRVGYLNDISEKVAQYHIDNFVKTELSRLLRFLGSTRDRTEAQELLYEALCNEDRGREIVGNMALESANLVCGTTIGVLQSKVIKESSESKPAFDYMILDEASKTTFQEFLVPALNAERWVLSGDPKQLAPYVDQDPIQENVANLPTLYGDSGREDKQVCLDVFSSFDKRSSNSFGKLVPFSEKSDLPSKYQTQATAVEKILSEERSESKKEIPLFLANEKPNGVSQKLNLFGSSLVLVPESKLKMMEEFLPPTLRTSRNIVLSETYDRRKMSYAKYLERKGVSKETRKTWENQIAWRIARLYELRELKERQKDYLLEIRLLLPHFEIEDLVRSNQVNANGAIPLPSKAVTPRDERLLKEIRRIERIALPSVLELLQLGFGEKEVLDEDARIPLYNGLPKSMLDQRHILLTYQHRMHPQISVFPREKIYSDNQALLDSSDVEKNREWECDLYANRAVWVNTKPSSLDVPGRASRSNYNLAEVRAIVNHLKSFIKWSGNHPSPEPGSDGHWSVAVLSFYKGQENKISEAMRNLFPGSIGYRYFESPIDRIRVEVCSVDRFQGHEADLVFVSFVNSRGNIGFLDNRNRLNVAVTRAKYQLVLVGDRRTFGGTKSTDLLRDLERMMPDAPIEF